MLLAEEKPLATQLNPYCSFRIRPASKKKKGHLFIHVSQLLLNRFLTLSHLLTYEQLQLFVDHLSIYSVVGLPIHLLLITSSVH